MTDTARISDDTFTAQMWRAEEMGSPKVAAFIRQMWKHAQTSEGYRDADGALSHYEIDTFAAKFLPGAGAEETRAFARAVERAALIKAMTLLPELHHTTDRSGYRPMYRDGMAHAFAIYSGAIRAIAMGRAPSEPEIGKPVAPRRAAETIALETAANSDGVRMEFEAWSGPKQFDLRRRDDSYVNLVTGYAWMGWLAANAPSDGYARPVRKGDGNAKG